MCVFGLPIRHRDYACRDIDLLKLRTVVVIHRYVRCYPSAYPLELSSSYSFLDSEVTAPDFKETVRQVVKVVKPLVHWQVNRLCRHPLLLIICRSLNDMMTLPVDEDDESENAGEDT